MPIKIQEHHLSNEVIAKLNTPGGVTQAQLDAEINARIAGDTLAYNTTKKFIGYSRFYGIIYSDVLEDLMEDNRMQYGTIEQNCINYDLTRDVLNTKIEIFFGKGYIYGNGFKMKLPVRVHNLRLFGGTLTPWINAPSFWFASEISDANIDLNGQTVFADGVRFFSQYGTAVEYLTGTGNMFLQGSTNVAANYTTASGVTVHDLRDRVYAAGEIGTDSPAATTKEILQALWARA